MKKFLAVALGVLTAIGGFVDIGELVTAPLVGARFGMTLAWATVLSLLGIMIFSEMSGRVAAMSQRPVFDLIRERTGPRVGLVALVASFIVTLATVAAEIGGVALALQLATSVNYLMWVPLVAVLAWLIAWRVKFKVLENALGLAGLALLVVIVAVIALHPDWGGLVHQATHPHVPSDTTPDIWLYFAIALFGAGLMPYEVFFFSSGGVEEHWTEEDIPVARANILFGFPLGVLITLALMAGGSIVLGPKSIDVSQLYQSALPTSAALGRIGLAIAIIGFVACTFGAAVETMLSCGYMVAQNFGWAWGKMVRPREDARFHLVLLGSIIVAMLIALSGFDPIKLTEYVVVFSAAALPLTYFPVLVVANDPTYMGTRTNGRFSNVVGVIFLILVLVVSVATIPLMIITRAGA
jgi:Mn2+/Fe2+ NRAMP family transporter